MPSASITQHHHLPNITGPQRPESAEPGCLPETAPLCIRAFWFYALAVFLAGHITQPHRECTSIMGRLVIKFGGTSVPSIHPIRHVANHVNLQPSTGHPPPLL